MSVKRWGAVGSCVAAGTSVTTPPGAQARLAQGALLYAGCLTEEGQMMESVPRVKASIVDLRDNPTSMDLPWKLAKTRCKRSTAWGTLPWLPC